MGMARYVVDAVRVEGRSAREVAAAHGISRSWIYELIKRFPAGGYEAVKERSHRQRSCPSGTTGPSATLPARRDFANGLYAPSLPGRTYAAPGPGRASPVLAPTIRPFRSLYPGGS